ncbi:MAG TPA: assimilatory sulfite reductase (NADPH) flavoprotein subunit [Hyphomicrobiaceae bacterium]|nr:assimilatory sulfite reductase (NADPH) flavoprotein subunit [Hyphomicrobiaceae bacterium]
MTKPEFLGPGLSAEQWQRVDALAAGLTAEQAVWISGFFAGLGHRARAGASLDGVVVQPAAQMLATATAISAARTLTVLFASETGNSAGLAKAVAAAVEAQGAAVKISNMADYKPARLREEQDLLVITSTHGEGDPPQTAVGFFEFLEGRKAPQLPHVRFAVLALGDSTYERYCEAGKRIDRRLEALGAQRLMDRVDCDVDFEDAAAAWISSVVHTFAPAQGKTPALPGFAAAGTVAALPAVFDKKNPFIAPVLDNIVLTGRGSTKETRHIELSLAGSGLAYEPGDALGVMPQNDPALVEALLGRLALSADAHVDVKGRSMTLGEALTSAFEITAATPRFLEHWARISAAKELSALSGDAGEARTAFLRQHHVLDIIERFPVPGIGAETLLAGLRPLQPRLYSIASSLAAAPDEVHLTVSTVRYDLNGLPRRGVASGDLARRTEADATVPVYIQASPHFRLPDDDVPILMIGAGTGVAPYRAFMQEREARGAKGHSWLVFGERNFRSDFLYQVEWQALLKAKVLTRMDLAFSRDSAPKTYVQDRLRQHGRDVYAWLEDGARVYVCGDATSMAPGVHAAFVDLVQRHGAMSREAAGEYLAALQSGGRYLLDVY